MWRIVERTDVYDKDRIDLLESGASPGARWDASALSIYRPEARHLCWWLDSKGLQLLPDLIYVYSEEERRLRDECRAWMSGGA